MSTSMVPPSGLRRGASYAPVAADSPATGTAFDLSDSFFTELLEDADEETRQLLADLATAAENSHARSTLDLYRYYWDRWEKWALDHGHAALPADPRAVALYTVWMSKNGGRTKDEHGEGTGLRPATIANHLLAIRLTHLDLGHTDPTAHPALKRVLKGIRKMKGTRARKRTPMTYQPLMQVVLAMDLAHDVRRAVLRLLLAADAAPLPELATQKAPDVPVALSATQLMRLDLDEPVIDGDVMTLTVTVRGGHEREVRVERTGEPTCLVEAVEELRALVDELLGFVDAGHIVGKLATSLRATWHRNEHGKVAGQLLPRFDRTGRIAAGRPTRSAVVGMLCDLGFAAGATPKRRTLPTWTDLTVAAALREADRRPLVDLRDRALLLIGWHTAARRSNLSWLRRGEIVVVDANGEHNGGLEVLFRKSKTDQEQQGVELVVPATGDRFCAARAWQAWDAAMQSAAREPLGPEYPAFPPTEGEALGEPTEVFQLDAAGNVALDRSGRPVSLGLEGVSGGSINRMVQKRAETAGLALDDNGKLRNWGGHSLRRGWLTEAARQGMSLGEMQAVSGHSSIDTLMGYVAAAKKWDTTASAPLKMSYERMEPRAAA